MERQAANRPKSVHSKNRKDFIKMIANGSFLNGPVANDNESVNSAM